MPSRYSHRPRRALHFARAFAFLHSPPTSLPCLCNSQEFIKDFQDGKLEPYLKSEPVPEDDGTGVTTVVGKNFDEVVTNSGKDVFIEFYAPWW